MEKKIVKIICECAKIYDKNLKGKNLIFIFENQINKKIEYIETEFLVNNFRHFQKKIERKFSACYNKGGETICQLFHNSIEY